MENKKEKRTVEDALKTTNDMMNSLPKELDFSYFLVHKDIEDYKKYLLGATVDFSKRRLAEMWALGILDKLGYPMDKPGTYLFKELVADVYDMIKDDSANGVSIAKDLSKERSAIKSSLCEYLEMSEGKYDKLVSNSIKAIDHELEDKETANKVYGPKGSSQRLGFVAYRMAEYIKYMTVNRKNHVIGRFSATTFEDKDIYFKVYDNNVIECTTLGVDFARWINLKPRFELHSETYHYVYDAPKSYKGDTRNLVKEYNIDEELLAYLKSKGMVRYSTDMAYLYDFKDKNGYDKKDQTRSFKWASPKKSLKLARQGFFN